MAVDLATLVVALTNTLKPEKATIDEATNWLSQAGRTYRGNKSTHSGYCLLLMQTVDEPQLPVDVKLAALSQLRTTIKIRWKHSKECFSAEEKTAIKNSLIEAIIRCQNDIRLIKLYREVLLNVLSFQFPNWIPLDTILDFLARRVPVSSSMHCLIALATSFNFCTKAFEKQLLKEFATRSLPAVSALLAECQDIQIVYLSLKLFWKTIRYEASDQVKQISLTWMPFLARVVSLVNPEYDQINDQHEQKQTPRFFYVRAKKWATRILLRFLQYYAKVVVVSGRTINKEFSQLWHSQYDQIFLQSLKNQFAVPNHKKVRYFQLKSICMFSQVKPDLMLPLAESFFYNVLPPYMMVKPEDEQLAQSDPLEFIMKEDDFSSSYTNLKRAATDVLIEIAEASCKPGFAKTVEPNMLLSNFFTFACTKVRGDNLMEKQFALQVFYALEGIVRKIPPFFTAISQLLETNILNEIVQGPLMLKIQAINVLSGFLRTQVKFELLKKATDVLLTCLNVQSHPIVRIKAAEAFTAVLRYESIKESLKPHLQSVLGVYIDLLQKYDLESLIASLQEIVVTFSSEIPPFANQLIIYLIGMFKQLCLKDEGDNDQQGNIEMTASGALRTISQIIQTPVTQELLAGLENDFSGLCEFFFTTEICWDYSEQFFSLLSDYMGRMGPATPRLDMYFDVLIYSIVSMPKEIKAHLNNIQVDQNYLRILNVLKNSFNPELIQFACQLLVTFLARCANSNVPSNIRLSRTQLVSYLCNQIYRVEPKNRHLVTDMQFMYCTNLFTQLLEWHRDWIDQVSEHIRLQMQAQVAANPQAPRPQFAFQTNLITQIWPFAICNMEMKSKILRSVNAQLLATMAWIRPTQFIKLANHQKCIEKIVKQFITLESQFEAGKAIKRICLGMFRGIDSKGRTEN